MSSPKYNRLRLYPNDEISLRMGAIYVRFPIAEIKLARIVIELLLSEKLAEARNVAKQQAVEEAPAK